MYEDIIDLAIPIAIISTVAEMMAIFEKG